MGFSNTGGYLYFVLDQLTFLLPLFQTATFKIKQSGSMSKWFEKDIEPHISKIFCTLQKDFLLMYQSNRSFNIPPPRTYPVHIWPFLAREGGNLIITHRGWGIWSLASMSCYEINHGGDSRDIKLWWIQRVRLRICGGLVENQRPIQAVFCIWRCLKTIYVYNI